ncbi:L-2-amino-thiazoline-4-carboxylic acid hydrolase [Actinoplanes sp. LDG1-06]|uniref:L-2-amino-thiazoline-4-carboxylic acid hydrolase n=1 Tax=Paractinoplanes ovalisporus TaxID=2810368 RepID=A0ABS2AVF5_9ACTN|nr:L-2-amino-thiazoline-4-carboxylic acid hydrolase [Actinoplanes ovalisporus]MBM2623786.1 L-2-amino-thiazoline-4-carboxylic acid hydrolase [Actinoplanes ovalisporus]
MALEGRWFMGRFAPRELLEGIDLYLRREAPGEREKILDTIRVRAGEIATQDADMPVDPQSEGMLALTSTVQAAYEVLLPVLGGDERRTVLFLRHVVGEVARRPFEVAFSALGRRPEPMDAIEKACRKEAPLYGDYYEMAFERPGPGNFEMRVGRCFFLDHFTRRGNPGLTTVMCAWDANWMRAVDPAVSGLRAERTTLMSQGGDACRFRVVATDDPLAAYSDALEELA